MKDSWTDYLKILLWIVAIGGFGYWFFSSDSDSQSSSSYSAPTRTYDRYGVYDDYDSGPDYDTMYDLAYDNWDTVREYIDGTETVEACSDSGCYSLDADISSGYIETLYFPNGGYIYPDAEIDSDGYAEGYDYEGNYWEFNVDSGLIEDAIDSWIEDYQDEYSDYQDEEEYYRR
jgi:hypothetical protein